MIHIELNSMKLDMRTFEVIVILYISIVEAIQCINVSSKIAFEPSKRSFTSTSYTSKPDTTEFNDSPLLPELPSSVLEQLKFVTPIDNILQPQNFNKLTSSYVNKPNVSTTGNIQNKFESHLCNFSTNSVEDSEGNLITTIKFSIMTKKKKEDIKAEDIPVIDGVRGIHPERTDPPNFPNRPNCSTNIPQPQKPRPNGHFVPSCRENGNEKFHSRNPWLPGRGLVNDKLAPPFSKIRSNNE